MAASPLHLPQELVDSIIDYVGDDRSTLCSCALVSRSWLHSSRYHLFASISLSPQIQENIPPQQRCAQLYEVLQESPVIIPYIRKLQILDHGLPPHRTAQWISTERTLPPLLKLLTHLRHFELSALPASGVIQWKSLPFTLQNAICTLLKLPSLTYLRLHSWTFPSHVSLEPVISSCQHLKCLSLRAVAVCDDLDNTHHSESSGQPKAVTHLQHPLVVSAGRPTDDSRPELDPDTDLNDELSSGSSTTNTRAPTPSLEVLTLDYVNFGYFGHRLFAPSQSPSPISFGNLRELRVSHSADPLIVERILLFTGPSLEHLHLKPGEWDVFFDLRNNSNLKSLGLTLEVPETALSWCTILLSSLSPSGFLNSVPLSSSTPSSTPDHDSQLTHISLEFYTDLKKLSASSPSTTTTVSPSTSPYHASPSLLPSSISPSSSPLSSSVSLNSQSSSSASTFPERSRSPEQYMTPTRRQSHHQHYQGTWDALDSILSLLPSPLKQIDIGLFAQPSHPDFVRVQEALGGIRARMHSADVSSLSSSSSSSLDDDGHQSDSDGESVHEKNDLKGNGAVRVYQLGLKSQRSYGRIRGPRLRSFEGNN